MLIQFTEEQQMIRDTVRAFTKNEVAPRDSWMDQNDCFDRELFAKFNELGLGGVLVPEEYGGIGADYVTSTIIVHELAKGSASFALAVEISHVAAEMITNWGTDEQKKTYLTRVANGDLFAFGLTEDNAGSDAAGIRSVAKKNPDGSWTLNGGKSWITNSGEADVYLILAKTDPDAGAKGISAFIIPKETPGLIIAKHEKKMGMRGSSTCALSFDNIQLPAEALLGPEGVGFKIAMSVLDGGRISCAAIATALSQHAMQVAKDYANERVTFGKPIARHQGIMFKFGDMSALIQAMELMTYEAAFQKAAGQRCTLIAAQAKLFAATHCTQICLDCLQVLGGNGYSQDFDVERFVRDAKLLEIGEGTNEILRMVIGGTVLAQK